MPVLNRHVLFVVCLLVACFVPTTVLAEDDGEPPEEDEASSEWAIEFGGYGQLDFAWLNYGPDPTRDGGARRDSRLVFNQTRFVFEIEGEMPLELEFEAEIEYEHGGTGAALELEYEEFGEYEQEVEKGGEVLVEELYLKKGFFDEALSVKIGRFYTAVGLLSGYYKPTDYLAAGRPESETTVIPAVWDEMGLEVSYDADVVEVTGQLLNGLDSTGFGSRGWISGGHHRRFGDIRATALAGVLRADVRPVDGLELGVSGYYGATSANRPKPDMTLECDESNDDTVAPCGYLDAPVMIGDVHAAYDSRAVRARALLLYGHLDNADVITERNRSLANALEVPRTDVSDNAIAAWAEFGWNLASVLDIDERHRIEPYVRGEYYDTAFNPRDSMPDLPRFESYIATGGASYTWANQVAMKLDYTHRWFGSQDLRQQDEVTLSANFVF